MIDVTTGTPRVDRPDASVSTMNTVARTRPVPGASANSAPTTAQLIRRTDATIARPLFAALGMALHHFTEVLDGEVDELELHRATTVLTKQVCGLMDDEHPLVAIQQLVTDPGRNAMPDGRPAAELCGDMWDDVRDVATRRSAASCEGAEEFGGEAIINLAVVRSVGATEPWWGTQAWRERVERLPAELISPDERTRLLERAELADDELLSLVLHGPPGTATTNRPRESAVSRPTGQDPVFGPQLGADEVELGPEVVHRSLLCHPTELDEGEGAERGGASHHSGLGP